MVLGAPLHSMYVPSETLHLCRAAGRVPALSRHTAFPAVVACRALHALRQIRQLGSTALQVHQQPVGLRVFGMILGVASA